MKLIKELGNKFVNLYDSLTNADSSWERPYDFYLIFGQTDEHKSPWITTNWKTDVEPYFDLLIQKTEKVKETGIRVVKYKSEKSISKKDNKAYAFHAEEKLGRLKWDGKSHEKWTMPNETEGYFLNFELWSPFWTTCDKRQSPPDIYIKISNERDFENKRNIKFGYFVVVAIAKSLKIDSAPILKELSEKINAKTAVPNLRFEAIPFCAAKG